MFMKYEHDNDNHIHKMHECTCIGVYTCMSVFVLENASLPCIHKNHIGTLRNYESKSYFKNKHEDETSMEDDGEDCERKSK